MGGIELALGSRKKRAPSPVGGVTVLPFGWSLHVDNRVIRRMSRLVNLPQTLQGVAPPGFLCFVVLILGLTPQANSMSPLPGLKTPDINSPNFRDEPAFPAIALVCEVSQATDSCLFNSRKRGKQPEQAHSARCIIAASFRDWYNSCLMITRLL